ncbi:MAG TPA: hemerythrin domain-containing protein [Chthonomonas sp.]|uniref:hemerythrin domain-containing protein n=1 Tax=Chthonomonas sp. TaxID=2282153 RepID=UPI002B4B902B|nr:hemerythrin domain-containing protein [Chthonomonas sp.]HLI48397.1 hemerythrin domain-containing protein [Chthonomonas sp.]
MAIQIGAKAEGSFREPLQLLSDCHRRIERFLQQLIHVAEQAKGDGLDEAYRDELDTALRYFENAEPLHTADEEVSLFPRLRAKKNEEADHVIATLEADHEVVGELHKVVGEIGKKWLEQGYLEKQELRELLERLYFLRTTYHQHIGIEDRVLFPLAATLLSSDELEAIGHEMADRRGVPFDTPPGTRCASRRSKPAPPK